MAYINNCISNEATSLLSIRAGSYFFGKLVINENRLQTCCITCILTEQKGYFN